jgi:hypothetical protein
MTARKLLPLFELLDNKKGLFGHHPLRGEEK